MNVAKASDEKLRDKAEMLSKHFSEIAKPFYEIDQMDIMNLKDLTEKVYDSIDNIWTDQKINPAYGEEWMTHFIKICSASFGAWIEKEM